MAVKDTCGAADVGNESYLTFLAIILNYRHVRWLTKIGVALHVRASLCKTSNFSMCSEVTRPVMQLILKLMLIPISTGAQVFRQPLSGQFLDGSVLLTINRF